MNSKEICKKVIKYILRKGCPILGFVMKNKMFTIIVYDVVILSEKK